MNAEAMTERFEMRLGQSVLEEVDAWRGSQGDLPSRSEAVRRLVLAGLGATRRDRKIEFSDGEKLTITMLCQLFKALKLKSEIEPEFVEAAIHGGHYWGLEWEYPGVFNGHEDARALVTEVVDVLDMWYFLERGYAKLTKKEKDRIVAAPFGKNVHFPGFDGNNESEHVGVARFLINQLDRFPEFKGRGLDAHRPTIDAYRRMFSVFEPIRRTLTGGDLNATQITEILNAVTHPSNQ
jgi:uncharacterized protein